MTHPSPVWHPFTQHGTEPAPPMIARTEAATLITPDGRRILDAISSWWVITHGHRQPDIMRAIRDATEQYDQIIFAGLTHEPAEQLARGLVEIAPPGLDRVFFSDSGSTAVEVALKMALGFFHNRGQRRSHIAVMQHGYHGDTVGGMSVGARGTFSAAYADLLFAVDTLPFPEPGQEQTTLDRFAALAKTGDMAALILEPLILGSGGMKMFPPAILRGLSDIAAAHGVLLIADEVMTGWGRTGTVFACEQAGITPDILCTSKGLTGGALPLAATLAKEPIFAAHCSTDRARMFFHSSSFTANPIACAAACANLDLWRGTDMIGRITRLGDMQQARLDRLAQDGRVLNPRRTGTITAFELRADDAGYLAEIGPALRRFFLERDVLLRPLGNTVYVLPPYCITANELDRLYSVIAEAVTEYGA